MKTLKSILNAAAIGIALSLILVTVAHLIIGRGDSPFVGGVDALLQTIDFALIGIFVWSTAWLFKYNKFGLKKANIVHFIISMIILFIINIFQSNPIGSAASDIHNYYTSAAIQSPYFGLQVVFLFLAYFFVWLACWFYYRYQLKQLNKKLGA